MAITFEPVVCLISFKSPRPIICRFTKRMIDYNIIIMIGFWEFVTLC